MKKEFCKINLTMTKEDHGGETEFECFGQISFTGTKADMVVVIANVMRALEIDSDNFIRMAPFISLDMKTMERRR